MKRGRAGTVRAGWSDACHLMRLCRARFLDCALWLLPQPLCFSFPVLWRHLFAVCARVDRTKPIVPPICCYCMKFTCARHNRSPLSGLGRSLFSLLRCFLSLVILIVAPIGLTGRTSHSFGSPIDLNSLSVKGLVMLAVKVIGKL